MGTALGPVDSDNCVAVAVVIVVIAVIVGGDDG